MRVVVENGQMVEMVEIFRPLERGKMLKTNRR